MQRIILILIGTFFLNFLFGQSNYEKFKVLFQKDDTLKIKSLMKEWEKTGTEEPEFYTSYSNYYFSQSKQELLSIQNQKPNGKSLQFEDKSGNTQGFISSNISYDSLKTLKAINYLDQAIEKFPNRLDIRFGKCYILEQTNDYSNFTKTLIETIEYSRVNNNNWLWMNNVKQKKGEEFLLSNIQNYLNQLYETQDDSLLQFMIQIGDKALEIYPKNIEIRTTTSVAYLSKNNSDKALEYLKLAENINPKDCIVINNIAQTYKIKGDKLNAIIYYKKAEKFGDKEMKKFAKQNIKELEK